jgi:hypothetical protein
MVRRTCPRGERRVLGRCRARHAGVLSRLAGQIAVPGYAAPTRLSEAIRERPGYDPPAGDPSLRRDGRPLPCALDRWRSPRA